MSLVDDLARAVATLRAAGVPSARTDAELLAAHAAGTGRGGLQRLVVMRADWPDGAGERFAALVAERAARVPLQHLTGTAGFRGLELAVGPGVFVPRPETELLAGLGVAGLAAAGPAPRAVDLCTGSGAVALALAVEVPDAVVGAVELEPAAHAWAERNVAALGDGRVRLVRGDAGDPAAVAAALPDLVGACAVVTANPPYVPDDMVPLDPEVAEHDPPAALYGGPDGMRVLAGCVRVAARLLVSGGLLALEHGEHQAERVAGVLRRAGGWHDVAHHVDLTGRPRVTTARVGGSPA
ncbi:peptide chain release factor N(5)-glutamine methyltransferase [Aquipuribacter sp. SD81]|uniref:peptide chain release factor N(5)-glutamine methyltransferase n=1 Tax=Aquipuribacter sp. SD81 TaxID=3127703 RepID=UPI003017A3DC